MATSTLGSGTLVLAGTTSGTTTVTATAVAGTTTLTLPAATDTLVGKATTDTLTNKTLTTPTLTGVVTFDAGTAAAPAITTTGDTNTGIFFPAADTIGFSEGGVEAARIDASGNFGLGVTPAATWSSSARVMQLGGFNSIFGYTTNVLRISNNSVFTAANETYGASSIGATYYQQYNGAHSWYNAPSGTAGNAITFTQAMTLDASGRLGLGTTSPTTPLQIQTAAATGVNSIFCTGSTTAYNFWTISNTTGNARIGVDSSSGGALATGSSAYSTVIGSPNATSLHLISNGTVQATIDTSGNLLVGTTNTNPAASGVTGTVIGPTGGIRQSSGSGASYFAVTGTSGTHIQFYTYNAGAVAAGLISSNGSTTSYTGASDYRLKENIATMTGALAKVAQLNPVTYKWKLDGSDGQGFIAHELQTIFPDAVVGEKDAVNEDGSIKPQGVDTSFLVATLTAAIQEQQALITTLTARITALESA